jgi:hypothetical protein
MLQFYIFFLDTLLHYIQTDILKKNLEMMIINQIVQWIIHSVKLVKIRIH